MSSKKRMVMDEHGFLGVADGTKLVFIMPPEILGYVDQGAAALKTDRGRILMATLVGEKIDTNAPIFLEASLVDPEQASADRRGPLTFAVTIGGQKAGLRLMATQHLNARPQGELLTVRVTVPSQKKGN
jgi:hypothetical protein